VLCGFGIDIAEGYERIVLENSIAGDLSASDPTE